MNCWWASFQGVFTRCSSKTHVEVIWCWVPRRVETVQKALVSLTGLSPADQVCGRDPLSCHREAEVLSKIFGECLKVGSARVLFAGSGFSVHVNVSDHIREGEITRGEGSRLLISAERSKVV